MEELAMVLKDFGVMGLWGVVVYKLLEIVECIVVFGMIGLGIKKAWPAFKDHFN